MVRAGRVGKKLELDELAGARGGSAHSSLTFRMSLRQACFLFAREKSEQARLSAARELARDST
jgi:hypothetical protein